MQHESFEDYFNFLTSSYEGVMLIIFLGILIAALINHFGRELFRWLKGSRKLYYLYDDELKISELSARGFDDPRMSNPQSVVEINRSPFRRRSAIYGEAANNWRVIGDRAWPNTLRWVYLKDLRGLRIEDALQLINTYPSLQAMLDRIAELELRPTRLELQNAEDNLFLANERKVQAVAALQALNIKILDGKQRFRSQTSKEIRDNITFALREMVEIDTYHQAVDLWLEKFSKLDLKTGLLKPVVS